MGLSAVWQLAELGNVLHNLGGMTPTEEFGMHLAGHEANSWSHTCSFALPEQATVPCPTQAQHSAHASDQYKHEGVPDNGDRKQRRFEAAVMKCSSRKAESSLGQKRGASISHLWFRVPSLKFLVLRYEPC